MLNEKTILITGGTGSFGHEFVKTILYKYNPHKVIIYSRDEYKQYLMQKQFSYHKADNLRFFLGDVRDQSRLYRAFEGVDYVVHAAALKQVPALEYNPTEAVKTNVMGASNIIDAAVDAGVKKVVSLSTDKAVNPINLYGATKLVAEKLFVAANDYAGNRVKFTSVRYGNVIGSRGSVIPLFKRLKKDGIKEFPITHLEMTRFWISLAQSVDLVLTALDQSVGGEIFIPKIPSMRLVDLAKAIDPDCIFKEIGVRPGEKIHESLISVDEARGVKDCDSHYVILPQFFFRQTIYDAYNGYAAMPTDFAFTSDKNDKWLSIDELSEITKILKIE
jgi:UDP-N-acetylglucosamine 4,6-dehydratase